MNCFVHTNGTRQLILLSLMAGLLAGGRAIAGPGLDVQDWLNQPDVSLVAVTFYSPSCPSCVAAMPRWKALQREHGPDGFRLVVVKMPGLEGACGGLGWSPAAVMCDSDGVVAKQFGVDSPPATFLLRRRRIVLAEQMRLEQAQAYIERRFRWAAEVAGDSKAEEAAKGPAASNDGMVRVPAGFFHMGCNPDVDAECHSNEMPGQTIYLEAFRIDETEVTVAAYDKCVEAGVCSKQVTSPFWDGRLQVGAAYCNWGKAGRSQHPINCVDWRQAQTFCIWAGKRLPTEKEWEKAARGSDGRKYPWGNAQVSCRYAVIDDGRDGCGRDATWPVGSRPAGDSPYGAKDMVGNVWEWVADWYLQGETRGLRGGAWRGGSKYARASDRYYYRPSSRNDLVGFRCAQSE